MNIENEDHQTKITFTRKGAWLGGIAYLILIAVIVTIFLFG